MKKLKRDDQTSEQEDEIEVLLHKYIVKYPDENQINQTIDALRSYVPEKQKRKITMHERLYELMKQMTNEISIVDKSYWLISLLLYVIGYFFSTYGSKDYLLMLVMITPLPFVLGLFEVFKGRESGVLELEMACKFSAYQIMLSRLLLISLYNIGLSLILTFIVSTNVLVPIWEMILTWFAPLTIFVSITLWVSMRFRHTSFIVLVLLCWIIFSISMLLFEPVADLLMNRSIMKHLTLLIVGIVLCYRQVMVFINTYMSFDGADDIESSY